MAKDEQHVGGNEKGGGGTQEEGRGRDGRVRERVDEWRKGWGTRGAKLK